MKLYVEKLLKPNCQLNKLYIKMSWPALCLQKLFATWTHLVI